MASTKSQLAPKALPRPTIWCPKAWRLIGIRALWHSVFLKFAILNPKSTNISAGDAKLSFIAKIHEDLGHCMESIPKSDMASFIARFFLRNKLQCKKRTNNKSLKLYFRSCDTNQTREMLSKYPEKVSSLSCGRLMGQWRITLQAIDLSPSRTYCNPPQVGVLPRRSVCHHMMRLPRRARRGQLRGNQ